MKNPCEKHCLDRELGCHSWCPDYKDFRAYLDQKNEDLRKENSIYGYKKIKNDRIDRRMRTRKKWGCKDNG